MKTINVGAQKIGSLTMKIYEIVIARFLLKIGQKNFYSLKKIFAG